MTTECLSEAWNKSLDANEKLVLMWIADSNDFNQPMKIDPSRLEQMSRFSDQSARGVYQSIQRLVEQGHLEWADEHKISVLIPFVR